MTSVPGGVAWRTPGVVSFVIRRNSRVVAIRGASGEGSGQNHEQIDKSDCGERGDALCLAGLVELRIPDVAGAGRDLAERVGVERAAVGWDERAEIAEHRR